MNIERLNLQTTAMGVLWGNDGASQKLICLVRTRQGIRAKKQQPEGTFEYNEEYRCGMHARVSNDRTRVSELSQQNYPSRGAGEGHVCDRCSEPPLHRCSNAAPVLTTSEKMRSRKLFFHHWERL